MMTHTVKWLFLLLLSMTLVLQAAPKKRSAKPASSAKRAVSAHRSTAASRATVRGKSSRVRASRWARTRGRYTASRSRGRRVQPVAVVRRSYGQQGPTQERVTEIQMALAQRGFLNGTPNGHWDQESIEALKRFQEKQNMQPTGKLNAISIIALGLGPKRDGNPANLQGTTTGNQ